MTAPVIGRDPYPLPNIYLLLSPAMRILWDRYRTAFVAWADEDDEPPGRWSDRRIADAWADVTAELAAFQPACVGDAAGKLALSLHHDHPTLLEGEMAIDSSSVGCTRAAEMTIACLADLVRMAGAA